VAGYVAYRESSGQLSSVPGVKLFWERILPSTPPVTAFATTAGTGQYQVSVHTGNYQVRIEPPTGFEGGLEQVKIEPTTTESTL